MANKSKKTTTPKVAKPASEVAHVTRITASDKKPVAAKTSKAVKSPKVAKEKKASKGRFKAFRSIGGYFKGAWFELRQVRWPNRRATWSLTAAVLIFTAFFVVLVVLLDIMFKYLFEVILG
jgi:preprotein translocase subunit SecE